MASEFTNIYCPGCSPNDVQIPHICGYGRVTPITTVTTSENIELLAVMNCLHGMESKLERIETLVNMLVRWFGPEFDEEGNVVK